MRDDAVLEGRPKVPVTADQAWFWSEWWQLMERKADDGVAAGRVARYDNASEFLASLKTLRGKRARSPQHSFRCSKRCCQMYSIGVTVEATPCRASNHAIDGRNWVASWPRRIGDPVGRR